MLTPSALNIASSGVEDLSRRMMQIQRENSNIVCCRGYFLFSLMALYRIAKAMSAMLFKILSRTAYVVTPDSGQSMGPFIRGKIRRVLHKTRLK